MYVEKCFCWKALLDVGHWLQRYASNRSNNLWVGLVDSPGTNVTIHVLATHGLLC